MLCEFPEGRQKASQPVTFIVSGDNNRVEVILLGLG